MKRYLSLALAGCALFATTLARADDNAGRKEALHEFAVQAIEKRAALDPATAERVQKIVEQYREPIKSVRRDRRLATRELRKLLRAEKPADARVRKLEEKIVGARAEMAKLDAERLRDLGKALTPEQLGKLLVSWNAINRSIRHQIRNARSAG